MITKQTTLDLNGPIIEISQNPVNVGIVTNGSNVTFSGIATATYPSQTPSNPAQGTGTIIYQWYDSRGILSNGSRNNGDGTTTTFDGVETTTLTITNVNYLEDDLNQYYFSSNYVPSAYGSSPITAGTARSTGDAINEPLFSERATLSLYSEIEIVLQPSSVLDGSTETFSTFNVNATTLNPQEDDLLSYRWRVNGNNLSDGANVSGSRTKQLTIKQSAGIFSVDVVISHPNTFPSSVTSNSVTFEVEDPRQIVVIENVDISVEPARVVTSSVNLNSGPLNVSGSPSEVAFGGGPTPASTLKFLYAPEKDLDVVIEMAGAGGQSFGGVQAGQGGWGIFRMTLRQNVEYSIKLGPSDASFDPYGGRISGTARGGVGGGGAFFYEKNRLIAVLGGGGGAGAAAAGGDGGGLNLAGQKGFGRNGGDGGGVSLSTDGNNQDRFAADRNGGRAGSCPKGGSLGNNTSYFRNIGISDCSDYTNAGNLITADTGKVIEQTAILNRGWRTGVAGRVNGGWGINGAGGAGGGGAEGGDGSIGNGDGGGGGSGYADTGKLEVLNTLSGVNTGNAYMRIKIYDPADPIPNPPVPAPPNAVRVSWDDTRNLGYKYGDEFNAGGSFQTVPGAFIRGPGGVMSSPPFNYATAYTNYRSGPQTPNGIFFTPSDSSTRDTNISYIRFRLRLREYGPRPFEQSTIYLNNRGNRDPNLGRTRRWWTSDSNFAARYPDLYTTSVSEAFVPFRVEFRVQLICAGNGNYRTLSMIVSQSYFGYGKADIDFDSTELARQNGLPTDGSGRILFQDYFFNSYDYPRISNIDAQIINLDLNDGAPGRINGINMFSDGTSDSNKRNESNFLEFGKYIIT